MVASRTGCDRSARTPRGGALRFDELSPPAGAEWPDAQPYLRSDGSLTIAAGYDAATGMFCVFDAREFAIPEHPTRAEAKAALTVLKELLAEFSFASDTDLAATLAALLTAAVRPSLRHAPMFHVRAHMVGSGKSYLCELITAFATPQRGTRRRSRPMTRNAESCCWRSCCARRL